MNITLSDHSRGPQHTDIDFIFHKVLQYKTAWNDYNSRLPHVKLRLSISLFPLIRNVLQGMRPAFFVDTKI